MSKKINTGLEIYGLTGETYVLKAGFDSSNFLGFSIDSNGTWKIDPQSSPGSGRQGIIIGADASGRTNTSNISIGYRADTTDPGGAGQGTGGISIGSQSVATGDNAIALGSGAQATKWGGIAIGFDAVASTSFSSGYGVGIGYVAEATSIDSIAIGRHTLASSQGSIMIGHNTTTIENSTTDSVAFGWNANTISFLLAKTGDSYLNGSGDLGVGLTGPTAKLHVKSASDSAGVDAFLVENLSGTDLFHIESLGNVGVGTSTPTDTLHVNGLTGSTQFRLEQSYTPASSADTAGNIGSIAWDDTYLYTKTNTGWGRVVWDYGF